MSYKQQPFRGDTAGLEDSLRWLQGELARVEDAFASPEVDHIRLKVWHEEPKRISEGLVVMADGTNWDPGTGAGLYRYTSSTWVRIG